MRITTNGTTISGSLSEVLATLTHITQLTAGQAVTAKPVTTPEVTETAVTYAVAGEREAEIHAGESITPVPEATTVPVPKPARDSVIKMAIADVEALLSTNYSLSTDVARFVGESLWFTPYVFDAIDEVLFTVNEDKRTVNALVRRIQSKKEISKGRAKCAPGDIFNEHIGKAIALRRALGLEVPVEYTEVADRSRDDLAVCDVVRGDTTGNILELTAEKRNPLAVVVPGKAFDLHNGKWIASSQVTLINDSARHTAPDLEVSRIIRH